MANVKQRSIGLTDRQWDAVDLEATRLGITASDVVRRVLDAWLDEIDFKFYANAREEAS